LGLVPGSAGLVLVGGVVHLDEDAAVFEAMLAGWARQQKSRLLGDSTIASRVALLRRFNEFSASYPWSWTPSDVEDFTVSLMSGADRRAPSTIRGYHLTIRMFCDYLCDGRYGWASECRDRFGQVPSQVCHEWNSAAHLTDYEGRPARRPFGYDEVQTLFDFVDDRVERVARSGRKGSLAALRDAVMVKTAYAFGLRRSELCRLEVADLRPNPHVAEWGTYGSVHVRYGKAIKGACPAGGRFWRSRSSTGSSTGYASGWSRPGRSCARGTIRRCG
jgi:integrase/recombinase XerC